jgi:hypothetical protein
VLKFVSWSLALGSGTSGGTLAPLFTVGGGLGAVLVIFIQHIFPQAATDPRIGALVGMAAMFAGASRALLASVVFAFETTRQPLGLLPLLAGCAAAYMMSCLWMRHSIMTEKIARRGVRVTGEYDVDALTELSALDAAAPASPAEIASFVADPPKAIAPDASLREAVMRLHQEGAARLIIEGQGKEVRVLSHRSVVTAMAARVEKQMRTSRSLEVKPRVVLRRTGGG